MNIHSNQRRLAVIEDSAGFFRHFATGHAADIRVLRLTVSAGQQPPIQPVMVDEQHLPAIRAQHCAGTRDVSGRERVPRERIGRKGEKRESQVTALPGFSVSARNEAIHQTDDVLGYQHFRIITARYW